MPSPFILIKLSATWKQVQGIHISLKPQHLFHPLLRASESSCLNDRYSKSLLGCFSWSLTVFSYINLTHVHVYISLCLICSMKYHKQHWWRNILLLICLRSARILGFTKPASLARYFQAEACCKSFRVNDPCVTTGTLYDNILHFALEGSDHANFRVCFDLKN